MADSSSWSELAARFRSLQSTQDGLLADWDSVDRQWVLSGAPSNSVLRRFKSTARLAGVMLGKPQAKALDGWLNRLKADEDVRLSEFDIARRSGPHPDKLKRQPKKSERHPKARTGVAVTIDRVCEVSADQCEKLGDLSHQAEAMPAEKPPGKQTKKRQVKPIPATARRKKQRRDLVRAYRSSDDLTYEELGRRLKMSTTAIYGMISGDRSRYSLEKQKIFLDRIGVTQEEWDGK